MINTCAPGPEQMARRKSSTCVQDRLRFSEALGLATTVSGIGRSLSTDCRSAGAASDHCWIVFPWAHTSTAGLPRPRPNGKTTEDKHERSSREGSRSLFGSGGNGSPQLE